MTPGYKVYLNSQLKARHNDRKSCGKNGAFQGTLQGTSQGTLQKTLQKNQQIDRRKIKQVRTVSPQNKMLKSLLDSSDLGIAVAVYKNRDGDDDSTIGKNRKK